MSRTNLPPRGFLPQNAAPSIPSPSYESPRARPSIGLEKQDKPTMERSSESSGSIRRLQQQLMNDKPANPLIKTSEDDRARTNSDVSVRSRAQNIETTMVSSPTAMKVPVPSPPTSPRSSISGNVDNGGRNLPPGAVPRQSILANPPPRAIPVSVPNPPTPTNGPSSWHSKSMLSSFTDAVGMTSGKQEPPPKRDSSFKSMQSPRYDTREPEPEPERSPSPRTLSNLEKRGSYHDVTKMSFPGQKLNIGASMIAQKRQQG